MRVFHFLNKVYGLKDIKDRRIKIATIMELNDPFEFLSLELSHRDLRKAILKTKKTLAKNRGLLCFSKNWSNPVQWAHYADKHKGVCLGFDIPDNNLVPVTYSSKRLIQEAQQIISGGAIDEALMLRLLTTKFYHWHYERELRYFVSLEEKDENGFFYAYFSDVLVLKQVIVGGFSNISRTDVAEALGNLNNEVEVFKARPAFKSFRVVRNTNESLWA